MYEQYVKQDFTRTKKIKYTFKYIIHLNQNDIKNNIFYFKALATYIHKEGYKQNNQN